MATYKNTYSKGLNKDLSKAKFGPEQYYELNDFRVVTQGGLSSFALETERGNTFSFKTPSIGGIQKLIVINNGQSLQGANYLITINGESENFINAQATSKDFIYSEILALPGVAESISNGEYQIYNKANGIYFYTLNVAPVIEVQNTSGSVIESPIIYEQYIPDLDELKIIGWGNLRNDLILFTTGGFQDGQIWRISFDEETSQIKNLVDGSLTVEDHLVFYEKLNFSLEHPIMNEVVGRYENKNIQRVYWTDNLNPIRSLNVVGENLMELDFDDIDNYSFIDWDQPEIIEILPGEIPTGSVVAFAYRLKSSELGTVSQISPISNHLQLTEFDPQETPYWKYEGSDNNPDNPGRAIKYRVKEVEGPYDIMQHVAIWYTLEDVPNIIIFKESVNNTQEVIFNGNEDPIDFITEVDFAVITQGFTTAKTLAYKDKRLIAANLSDKSFDPILNFDTRAYRFNGTQELVLEGEGGGTFQYPFNFDIIDPEADCICPHNDENVKTRFFLGYSAQFQISIQQYKFNLDGELGGSGKNISYRFVTEDMVLDTKPFPEGSPLDYLGQSDSEAFPLAEVSSAYREFRIETNGIAGRAHPLRFVFPNHKDPVYTSLYTGYTRDETYRFGIVFYLKNGGVSPVKWIGDIRFPPIVDIGFTYQDTFIGTNSPITKGKTLGIEFSVNISEIENEIIGYRIVRTKREEKDKTVLGGGVLQPILNNAVPFNSIDFYPMLDPFASFYSILAENRYAVISPVSLFSGFTNYEYQANQDELQLEFNFFIKENVLFRNPNFTTNDITAIKLIQPVFYTFEQFASRNITGQTIVNKGSTGTIQGQTYKNEGQISELLEDSASLAFGKRQFVKVSENWPYLNDTYFNNPRYVNYTRKGVIQYGGNTFVDRTKSVYFPCSDYVNTLNKNNSINLKVFGGDTYIDFFSHEHYSNPGTALVEDKRALGVYFPVETPINIGLRYGNQFNKRKTSTLLQNQFENETYEFNSVYNQNIELRSAFAIAKNQTFSNEFPHRIAVSEEKLDGEFEDGWRKFLPINVLDVEGVFGEINRVTVHQDKLFFYQDKAFGVVPINEKVVLNDENGAELKLGTGDVIYDFGYISTRTGVQHKNAVLSTGTSLYHLDSRVKKMYKHDQSIPLTDLKGLSQFFFDNMDGLLINNDNLFPFTANDGTRIGPYSIQSAYDQKHNRVMWTVRSGKKTFTVAYNEMLDSFESFYGYKPLLWLKDDLRLFVLNPDDPTSVYLQDTGDYGVYFDKPPVESNITLIVNGQNDFTKEWNNLEWNSECTLDGADLQDTFSRLRIYTEVQDSGNISPILPLRRTWRTWRTQVPRDINSFDGARIRNPWLFVDLGFQNDGKRRFVCHDFMTHVQLTSFLPQ